MFMLDEVEHADITEFDMRYNNELAADGRDLVFKRCDLGTTAAAAGKEEQRCGHAEEAGHQRDSGEAGGHVALESKLGASFCPIAKGIGRVFPAS